MSHRMKRCSECKELRSLRLFSRTQHTPDRREDTCHVCLYPAYYGHYNAFLAAKQTGSKLCDTCLLEKPLTAFRPDISTNTRYRTCHDCLSDLRTAEEERINQFFRDLEAYVATLDLKEREVSC